MASSTLGLLRSPAFPMRIHVCGNRDGDQVLLTVNADGTIDGEIHEARAMLVKMTGPSCFDHAALAVMLRLEAERRAALASLAGPGGFAG